MNWHRRAPIAGIIIVILFFSRSLCFCAGYGESITTISAPEVKAASDKGNVMIINVLSRLEYEMQHIPGSISIPLDEMESTDRLPIDKDEMIIMYCMGHG